MAVSWRSLNKSTCSCIMLSLFGENNKSFFIQMRMLRCILAESLLQWRNNRLNNEHLNIVIKRSPLTAATGFDTRRRYVDLSPLSRKGGLSPGTLVFSHPETTRTHTSVPTSMINICCITCFVIVVK